MADLDAIAAMAKVELRVVVEIKFVYFFERVQLYDLIINTCNLTGVERIDALI